VLRHGERKRNYKETSQTVSPKTVNADLSHLQAVLRMADNVWRLEVHPKIKRENYLIQDPVIWAERFLEVADTPVRTLTMGDQQRVLDWCGRSENRLYAHVGDLLQVGIWQPLRKSTLVKLDWSQVDMENQEIEVFVKSRKPGGRRFRLPITRPFYIWLCNHDPAASGRVFKRWNPKTGPLDSSGRRLGAWVAFDDFKHAWQTVRRECDLGSIRFHEATRKTGATRISRAAGDMVAAQRALGHSDLKTTQLYVGLSSPELRSAMNAAADSIDTPRANYWQTSNTSPKNGSDHS